MSAGHTPGPWFQAHKEKPSGMYATEVFDASGETIATIAWHPKPTTPDGVTGTYREGNAILIASAPALLAERDRLKALNAELAEALQNILAVIGVRIDDARVKQFDAARAVLNKYREAS